MPVARNKIFDEALSLPSEARLELVDRLIASLNLPIRKEIDALQAEEADRRVGQIDQREAVLLPGNEVFEET